ncbi:MAG TPA: YidB family protein [Roseomonas sp.]|nr:YidB family protein [Roseomonas sp.]
MSGFFSGRSGGGLTGGLSNGVKMAAVALLVQQLMKHARQEGAAPAGPAQATPAGGTGGLGDLGGLLGGLLGGGAMAGGGGLLGGLAGMLGGLRSQGLGHQVDSWVGRGENQPVSPQDLERQFDPQDLDTAAREAGTDRQSLLEELSRTLPQFVDRATPQGHLPQREEELNREGIGDLLSSLLRGGQPGGGTPPRG